MNSLEQVGLGQDSAVDPILLLLTEITCTSVIGDRLFKSACIDKSFEQLTQTQNHKLIIGRVFLYYYFYFRIVLNLWQGGNQRINNS